MERVARESLPVVVRKPDGDPIEPAAGRALTATPRRGDARFHRLAEGSVLYRAGGTVVLATASIDDSVPEFMAGRGKGWVTAEYQMHPRSNPKRREYRDGRDRPLGGRAREIQRLIGRALRAAIDLDGSASAAWPSIVTCWKPTAARAPRRSRRFHRARAAVDKLDAPAGSRVPCCATMSPRSASGTWTASSRSTSATPRTARAGRSERGRDGRGVSSRSRARPRAKPCPARTSTG